MTETTPTTSSTPELVSVLSDALCVRNVHERDAFISFQEEGHKYTISNDAETTYTSVTTWNHTHFPQFNPDAVIKKMMRGKNWKEGHKYWGMAPEEIKKQWSDNGNKVSGAGTSLHFNIECFMNNPHLGDNYSHAELLAYYKERVTWDDAPVEWKYFLKFVEEHPALRPYRTEWLIHDDDLKLSGSIDMVYENPDGTLAIYDWKRSKEISAVNRYNEFAKTECISHLPNSNLWHYALQLNTYKRILERKYGKQVTELYLVRLHPECQDETYDLIRVPKLQDEVDDLFRDRLKKRPWCAPPTPPKKTEKKKQKTFTEGGCESGGGDKGVGVGVDDIFTPKEIEKIRKHWPSLAKRYGCGENKE